jgi:hypothetical protein
MGWSAAATLLGDSPPGSEVVSGKTFATPFWQNKVGETAEENMESVNPR